ncbi:FG-GAP repeat domain-containing protein [Dapis sp. BLCC M229]|uniref:FG-GAP repeat domain-containing protein n=1 Tax=Dapis sp. BLCC M229 TaxID=3400188 RepID=UPI003CE6788A
MSIFNVNEQTGTNNPFDGIDVGYSSAPTFADLDGDGDLDLIVGELDGNLNYFENTGSTTNPLYLAQTGTDNPFNSIDGEYSTPTFADVDGDGDLDLIVGDLYEPLNYFENTGTVTNPLYLAQTSTDNPFNGIDFGYLSAPTFADLDGDGDLYLIVGELDGNLYYFENTGSATNPLYLAQTGTDNPFDGIDVGNFSTPTFADLDEDGALDLIVGESFGTLNYFEINRFDFVEQTGTNNPFDGIDVGYSSAPTFADLDGDGDLDLIVGELDGNLNYFENTGSTTYSLTAVKTVALVPMSRALT